MQDVRLDLPHLEAARGQVEGLPLAARGDHQALRRLRPTAPLVLPLVSLDAGGAFQVGAERLGSGKRRIRQDEDAAKWTRLAEGVQELPPQPVRHSMDHRRPGAIARDLVDHDQHERALRRHGAAFVNAVAAIHAGFEQVTEGVDRGLGGASLPEALDGCRHGNGGRPGVHAHERPAFRSQRLQHARRADVL